jgi:hypothetical protein
MLLLEHGQNLQQLNQLRLLLLVVVVMEVRQLRQGQINPGILTAAAGVDQGRLFAHTLQLLYRAHNHIRWAVQVLLLLLEVPLLLYLQLEGQLLPPHLHLVLEVLEALVLMATLHYLEKLEYQAPQLIRPEELEEVRI